MIQVTNPNDYTFTLEANRNSIALSRKTPIPQEHLNFNSKYPLEAEAVNNQLFVNPESIHTKWYPTPETYSEPEKLNKTERRIFDEILALRELEKIDFQKSHKERMIF